MIKNIIFDLSEVIISGYYGVEYEVERKTNISASNFLTRKKEIDDVFLDLMRNKMSEEDYYRILLENTNWEITIDDMKKIARQNLNKEIPGTINIIRQLKGKYKLILLSDYVKEWKNYILKNNTELKIFDEMYFSCDYGKLKSDDDTFTNILEQSVLKPEETLFIDDSSINIKKAQEQGLSTILFTNAKELEQKLIKLKILKEGI